MMARRVRRLAAIVVVLLLAGMVALVLATRPKLDDARNEVDRTWTPLRAPLGHRYDLLAQANEQLVAAGGGDRDVSRALRLDLTRWDRLRRAKDPDADAEARTADQLEGLATRLQAIVESSDRFKGVDALTQRIADFQGTASPLAPAIKTYNDAARSYEDERNGLLRRPVASVFGYDPRPQLLLSG